MTTFGQRRHSRSRPRPRDTSYTSYTQSGQQLAAICILSPVSFRIIMNQVSCRNKFYVMNVVLKWSDCFRGSTNKATAQPSPAHPGSEHLSKQEQAQASPETTREYRPSDFRWDISISIGDFGIELSENFNRWPGPTLLCLHSLVHGLSESKGFSPIAHWEKKWIGKEKNPGITREFRQNRAIFRLGLFSNSFFFPMRYRAESFWFG